MEATAPDWLNLDFMQDVLRRSEADDSIVVVDMSTKSATEKGDNYSSDLARVHVEFTRKQGSQDVTEKKSFIAKFVPNDPMRKFALTTFGTFTKEINVMTEALPKMNKLLGKEHRLSPSLVHQQKEEPSFLIIEDLTPLGFRMVNHKDGLDLDHSIMVIKNIARFHASSAVLCEREPEQKELHSGTVFNKDLPKEFTHFIQAGTLSLANQVDKWPELGETIAKKLQVIGNKLFDLGVEAMTRNDDEFQVITHGDCWVNNMLFRYDEEGKPIEHIFVDFQQSVYTSPATDLHYFLNTSPCPKVYYECRERLLDEYLHTLQTTLDELGYKGKGLTMSDLKKQMEDRAAFALVAAFSVLPLVLVDKSKMVPVEELMQPDNFDVSALHSDMFRQVIAKRIKHFDEIGLLDRFQKNP